jgi:toxin ParE1/3/4
LKPLVLTEQAAAELAQARRWYDEQADGLGSEFVAEFRRASGLIGDHPGAAAKLATGYRRYVLRRFPYGLVYLEKAEILLVVAVWHSARDPGALWKRLR